MTTQPSLKPEPLDAESTMQPLGNCIFRNHHDLLFAPCCTSHKSALNFLSMESHTYLIAKTLVEFHEDHSLASRGVDLSLLLAVPLTV